MNTAFYTKSGLAIQNLSRMFFILDENSRIPTITDICNDFSLSRGIVQTSINYLCNNNVIELSKHGKKGTILNKKTMEKLSVLAGWDSVTGTMPLPLNRYLSSFTTAICHEFEQLPVNFSFAYVTGSKKRLQALKNMTYDFAIVSESTADFYLSQYDYLKKAFTFSGCLYSKPYYLYFRNPDITAISDGMKVPVDSNSCDQFYLSQKLCAGKNVTFVNVPYTNIVDAFNQGVVDCMVYRQESQLDNFPIDYSQPIELNDYDAKKVITPVMLTNTANYAIDLLLEHYLNLETIKTIQTKVIHHVLPVRFF